MFPGRKADQADQDQGQAGVLAHLCADVFVVKFIVSSPGERSSILIQLIFLLPVVAVGIMGLFLFFEKEIAHDQVIHLRAHEAAVGVFRGADDWFPRTLKLVLTMTP